MHRSCVSLFAVVVSLVASPLVGQTRSSSGGASPALAGPLIGFGTTALMAGDELFVGRPGESDLFPMPGSDQGSVHVFRRSDSGWAEAAMLAPEDGMVGDGFGRAIATDGEVLMIGAPTNGGGAVYVYVRRDGEWTQVDRLAPEGLQPGDRFGAAVAYESNRLLAGAPGRAGTGTVFAYRSANGSVTYDEITPEDGATDGSFGAAIRMVGDMAVIGAPGPTGLDMVAGPPQFQAGQAFVYGRTGETWSRTGSLTPAGGGSFGQTIAIVGDEILVGAPVMSQASGAVFRFTKDAAGAWSAAGTIAPASPPAQGFFGAAMATAGDQLVVGAPGANGFHGAAYAFARGADGSWGETHMFTEETQGLVGYYGGAVAAGDGVIMVGAPAAEFFEGIGFVYTNGGQGWVSAGSIVESAGGLQPVTGGERRCAEDGEVAGFTCKDVDLVSFLPASAVGAHRGIMVSDLWGWTDPDTGREYAILGRFDGTSFVDVTDAENPVYLGNLPLTPGAHPNLWRDMKVYANHAFIVADNAGQHGMQVFDLTRLRDVSSPPVEFDADAVYDGIASAHNIVIDDESGFAYTVGNSGGGTTCGGALHMIDIRDPEHPTFAGCYSDPTTGENGPGYTHDAQCVMYHGPDPDYAGHEVCFNASENAVGIGDVTDKENPTPISKATYPGVAYTHQGWLSDDQRYFYVNDELDELQGNVDGTRTLVWDVEDLDDPVLVNQYISDNHASDHNLYVRGDYMYQSNYVSGLRIFDVSDPENPVPVGFFDTVPWGEDKPGFAGSWSNYPFFESGIILVSSMREGLFILRKRQTELVP